MELFEANIILRTVKSVMSADGLKLTSAAETDALLMLLDRLEPEKYLAPKIKHAKSLSKNSTAFKRAQTNIAFFRAIIALKNGIPDPVTALSIMLLHKSVFGDLDPDAGKPRAKSALTDGSAHTDPKYISGSLKSIVAKMNDIDGAPDTSKEDFAGYLSHYMREFIILHPFEFGSELCLRIFAVLFGKLKGFSLCYYRSPASVIKQAEKAALEADDVTPLFKLFLNCLSYERASTPQSKMMLPPKTRRELDRDIKRPERSAADSKPKQQQHAPAAKESQKSAEDRLRRAVRLQQKISKLNEQLTELIQPLEKQSSDKNNR